MKAYLLIALMSIWAITNSYAQSCTNDRYINDIFATNRTTIQYATAPNSAGINENLDIDIYQPVSDTLTKRPMIIMAFGGSFLAGSKRQGELVDFCESMCRKGYVVGSIDYRLGFNIFSTNSAVRAVYRAGQDMRAAVRYMKANAGTYALDTTKIWVGGNSAGGITAVHAAYIDESERTATSLMGATLSPDMGCGDCEGNNLYTSMGISGKPTGGVLSLWGAIGDLNWISAGDKPIISFHSQGDNTVSAFADNPYNFPIFPVLYGSSEIHDHMLSLGNTSVYHEFPGSTHEIWNNATDALFIETESAGFMYDQYRPIDPIVSGANAVCANALETYMVPSTPGSIYCWDVTGGTIASPITDANTIDIQWATSNGTITVREITCNVYESNSITYNITISTPATPTTLASTNVLATSADINWASTGTGLNYEIEYQIAGSNNWQLTTSTTNSLSITGLQPCTTYEYRVRSLCSATSASTYSTIETFTTGIDASAIPSALTTNTNPLNGDVTASWAAISGLDYVLEYQAIGGTSTMVNLPSGTSSYTFSLLDPCTEYQYRIEAICAISTTGSGYTAYQTFTTPLAANANPTALMATPDVLTGDIVLTWTGSSGIDYEVEYEPTFGGIASSQIVSNNTLTLNNLSPCQTYQFRVRAICTVDNSTGPYSAYMTFNTSIDPTAIPTGLTSTPDPTTGDITLNWTGGIGQSYEIEYQAVAGGLPITQTSNTNSLLISGLMPCVNYTYKVKAICALSNTSTVYSSSQTFSIPISASQIPTALTATLDPSSGDILIAWTGTTGLDYELEYQTTSGGTSITSTVSGTTTNISGLNYCEEYQYRIKAICPTDNSSTNYSAYETFTTPIDPTLIPTGLNSSTDPSTGDITLAWTAIAGLEYELSYQEVGATTPTTLSLTTNNYIINGLNACSEYEFQVKAVCTLSNTSTAYSNTTTFNTAIDPTAIPSALVATPDPTGDIAISWTGTSNLDYEVAYNIVGGTTINTISTSNTSELISDLDPCEEYEFRVRAVCTASNSFTAFSTNTTFATPIDPTQIPTGLNTSTDPSTGDITLAWTAITGLEYELSYQEIGATTPTTLSLTTNNYIINGLNACSEYEFQVKAVCTLSNTSTAYSNTTTFNTAIDPTAIPSALVATPDPTGDIAISWTGTSNLDYEVAYNIVGGTTINTISTSNTSELISDLDPCEEYEFRVRAVCTASNSFTAFSTNTTFATPIDPTQIPSNVTLSNNSTTGDIDITWTGASNLTYEIQYQVAGNTPQTQTTTGNSFSLSNPDPCSTYDVQIRATCDLSSTSTAYSSPQSVSTGTSILQLRAFLQGPYIGGGFMRTDLRTENLLPTSQPFAGAPWNYAGTESVATLNDIPVNAVDWILVELRDATAQTIIEQHAAFLLDNGDIVSVDGSTNGIAICAPANEVYNVILRHRNHLGIMTATPLSLSNQTSYDFSTALSQADATGLNHDAMIDLGGIFTMVAGDFNGEGTILANDFNLYQVQSSEVNEYVEGDVNLDSVVTVADFNLYQPNAAKSAVSPIRY